MGGDIQLVVGYVSLDIRRGPGQRLAEGLDEINWRERDEEEETKDSALLGSSGVERWEVSRNWPQSTWQSRRTPGVSGFSVTCPWGS